MARLRCPSCGFVQEADPSRAQCPRCGWAPGRPVVAAAAPAPLSPLPANPGPPPGGGRSSPMATWAFVLSLSPIAWFVLGAVLESFAGGEGGPFYALGVLGSILAIGGPVAAIALGVAARRDPTVTQGSRNLALAAVIIGAVTLGLYVVFAILVILVIAACASACGSCATPATAMAGAPCASLATRPTKPATRRQRWAEAFAHHPDLPALRADVFRVAGLRLCVGCFTAGPAFLAGLAATWLWPVPAAVAWGAGLPLAGLQGLSAAGWTTTRWRKVAVKLAFGAGAALVSRAILEAPWPEEVRSLALAGAGLLALASTRPRLRRIARLEAEATGAAAGAGL